jgi:hypothetical protein
MLKFDISAEYRISRNTTMENGMIRLLHNVSVWVTRNKISKSLKLAGIANYQEIVLGFMEYKAISERSVMLICDTVVDTVNSHKHICKFINIVMTLCSEDESTDIVEDILEKLINYRIRESQEDLPNVELFLGNSMLQNSYFHLNVAKYYDDQVRWGNHVPALLARQYCSIPEKLILDSNKVLKDKGVAGICDECMGSGWIPLQSDDDDLLTPYTACDKCHELGYLRTSYDIPSWLSCDNEGVVSCAKCNKPAYLLQMYTKDPKCRDLLECPYCANHT